jgi:hypothetical protein
VVDRLVLVSLPHQHRRSVAVSSGDFQRSRLSVAMGNAGEEVRRQAT